MPKSSSSSSSAAAAAATAAALVGLDIQYIKRDVADIKSSLKSMIDIQEVKIEELQNKVDGLAKIVYTGTGIAISISVLLKFIFK